MKLLASGALTCALIAPFAALAQTADPRIVTVAPPTGVVALQASASVEVPNDVLSITFSAQRQGAEAAGVQTALKQALESALAEARKIANAEQVDVRSGAFSVYPRHDRDGKITGWHGRAEFAVEGKDTKAIAELPGRIPSMTIAGVSYRLSRESRQKAEADVTGEAVARYQAKAGEYAKLFGYGGYEIREVNVQGGDEPRYRAMEMQAGAVRQASVDSAPLPTEPGTAIVSVSVSGTVQMRR